MNSVQKRDNIIILDFRFSFYFTSVTVTVFELDCLSKIRGVSKNLKKIS